MYAVTPLVLAAALAAGAAALPAHAHGNADHAKPPQTAPAEQKSWGIAGGAKSVVRTIEMKMTDAMRFTPERIEVVEGQTVRFVVRNAGRLMHEFVIGTRAELDAHAAMMVKFPTMEHDEPYMTHVSPGKSGEVVWTFNRPGSFEFACLIAGHYQAGMVGTILVKPAAKG